MTAVWKGTVVPNESDTLQAEPGSDDERDTEVSAGTAPERALQVFLVWERLYRRQVRDRYDARVYPWSLD
jgi:hypothetical protein